MLQGRQSPNKNFLEGAYKMLLLRNSSIKQGEVCMPMAEQSSGEEDEEEPQDSYVWRGGGIVGGVVLEGVDEHQRGEQPRAGHRDPPQAQDNQDLY